MNDNLRLKLENLPLSPGVYKFKDSKGKVLYIGKALNLNSRVNSYFRDTHYDRPHIIPMLPLVEDVEVLETENEVEALVLESALIKRYMPRHNVLLKDDKSYAWIYINTQDKFPTVKIVRALKKEEFKKGRLFGPYPSGRATKQLFRYIRKMYPFCTCNQPKEACLYFHLGLCNGPYQGYVTREQYMENIGEIIKFLQGRRKRHVSELEAQMREASKDLDFEKAAALRDRIQDLKHLGGRIGFNYFDSEKDFVKNKQLQYQSELEGILKDLGLPENRQLSRIECYDISNISGKFAYGSMVVAINGQNDPSHYRIFKIKGLETPNDFEMLKEVLTRRLKHIGNPESDVSLSQMPDMILIDGGKGQLTAVGKLIPDDILLVGISKGRKYKRAGGRRKDEFWIEESGETVQKLIKNHRILSNLRDEAHRFAIRHHRKARKYTKQKSLLDQVKGIGPTRKKELLKKFGSLDGIKKATKEQLNEVIKSNDVVEMLMAKLSEKK